eukprot:GHVU01034884.1.p3 GENE.GHVU01034884.1~~GHVU01034884.1.p3  ORF type:complete len:155 (-),score=14.94 GHVU01034884.1:379-843(-)
MITERHTWVLKAIRERLEKKRPKSLFLSERRTLWYTEEDLRPDIHIVDPQKRTIDVAVTNEYWPRRTLERRAQEKYAKYRKLERNVDSAKVDEWVRTKSGHGFIGATGSYTVTRHVLICGTWGGSPAGMALRSRSWDSRDTRSRHCKRQYASQQ